jgi:uncharacterized membrane protein YkvA (DUF1232 family)
MAFEKIKEFADKTKQELIAVYLASKHPKVPIISKILIIGIIAYALSPIDLIPDFIPVLGYLDDLIIIPLGLWLALKLIPKQVLLECRTQAQEAEISLKKNWIAGSIIILIWVLTAAVSVYIIIYCFK